MKTVSRVFLWIVIISLICPWNQPLYGEDRLERSCQTLSFLYRQLEEKTGQPFSDSGIRQFKENYLRLDSERVDAFVEDLGRLFGVVSLEEGIDQSPGLVEIKSDKWSSLGKRAFLTLGLLTSFALGFGFVEAMLNPPPSNGVSVAFLDGSAGSNFMIFVGAVGIAFSIGIGVLTYQTYRDWNHKSDSEEISDAEESDEEKRKFPRRDYGTFSTAFPRSNFISLTRKQALIEIERQFGIPFLKEIFKNLSLSDMASSDAICFFDLPTLNPPKRAQLYLSSLLN